MPDLSLTPDGVECKVKQDIVDDIVSDLHRFEKTTVVTKKEAHTFVGRVNFTVGLSITARPLFACYPGGPLC